MTRDGASAVEKAAFFLRRLCVKGRNRISLEGGFSLKELGGLLQMDLMGLYQGFGSAQARLRRAAFAAAAVAASLAAVPAQATEQFEQSRCRCAASLAKLHYSLPRLARKVGARQPVTIVAFGSSSTEGTPNLRKGSVYPSVLERTLSTRWPVPVTVINKGKGGEALPHMMARLDDILALRPDVIVWQLGVNDVLAYDSMSDESKVIDDAIDRMRKAGSSVVLVDLQYAPRVTRDPDAPVMQSLIQLAGLKKHVAVFRRFEVMKRIIEEGEASLPEMIDRDGLHMTELAHGCTGALLAESIADAASIVAVSALPAEEIGPIEATPVAR